MQITKCDICGKEVDPAKVVCRVFYKIEAVEVTPVRKLKKVKWVTRRADLCSKECAIKFLEKLRDLYSK